MNIDNIKGFLLDMDGTFYKDDHLLPGAQECLAVLNKNKTPFCFLTNNSSRNKKEYENKLVNLGIDYKDAKVFTSGDATEKYLLKYTKYRKIFLVGTTGLHESFKDKGLILVNEDPDVVVLGYDTTLTYQKLDQLCHFVVNGYPFIATHPDINCPTVSGFSPDVGAILACVKASTGRDPDMIIGKPNHLIIDMVAEEMGLNISDLAMIGDRLYTDIALGASTGLTTILVLTGETKISDLEDSAFQPDYFFEDLVAFTKAINKLP